MSVNNLNGPSLTHVYAKHANATGCYLKYCVCCVLCIYFIWNTCETLKLQNELRALCVQVDKIAKEKVKVTVNTNYILPFS